MNDPINEQRVARWLEPGESVIWSEHPDRPSGRLRIVARAAGIFALYALAYGLVFRHDGNGSLVLVAVVGVLLVVQTVRSGGSVGRARWYVITDRRVAVFDASRVSAETRVDSTEFSAQRDRNGQSGTLDWGPADTTPMSRPSRYSNDARPTAAARLGSLATLLGLREENRVKFDHVTSLDVTMQVTRRVRSARQVATPEPRSHRSRARPPRPLGFLDSRFAGVINAAVLATGSTAFVVGASLLVVAIARNASPFSSAPVFVLFALIFPLHFWTVGVSVGRTPRPRIRRSTSPALTFENLPMWALVGVGAVFIGCWITGGAIFSSGNLPGQPTYDSVSHRYFADDHGSLIPLSKQRYERAVDSQNILFLSGAVAFTVISVATSSDELLRRRRSPFTQRRSQT